LYNFNIFFMHTACGDDLRSVLLCR